MARLNACIHELNFLSDLAKRRRAEASFALLFVSPVILHLVYTSRTKKIYQHFEAVGLFVIEKDTKYVGYYHSYRHLTIKKICLGL